MIKIAAVTAQNNKEILSIIKTTYIIVGKKIKAREKLQYATNYDESVYST